MVLNGYKECCRKDMRLEGNGTVMDQYKNMTRKKACYYLGIHENASEEQIKRAYRYKAKLYHPDANPDTNTEEYYIYVQQAYEYLMNNKITTTEEYGAMGENHCNTNHRNDTTNRNVYGAYYPYMTPNMYPYSQTNPFYQHNMQNPRPAKVYESTAAARASYQRQKDKEKELKKIQKWDEEYKSEKKRQQTEVYGKQASSKSQNMEEEILEKIRAIWIAETIRRQIALDKEHREVLQRRKIQKAFMQQKLQDEDV